MLTYSVNCVISSNEAADQEKGRNTLRKTLN